jgi:hypothetical protein
MNLNYDKYNLWGVKDWDLFQCAMRLVHRKEGTGCRVQGAGKSPKLN